MALSLGQLILLNESTDYLFLTLYRCGYTTSDWKHSAWIIT